MQFLGHKQELYPGTRAKRVLSSLLLLAILFAQLAFATHQFDHSSTDIGDTCAECLLLDRTGDAPVAVELLTLPVSKSGFTPTYVTVDIPATPTRAYRQRAPPLA